MEDNDKKHFGVFFGSQCSYNNCKQGGIFKTRNLNCLLQTIVHLLTVHFTTGTPQIYLELHFCVELHTIKPWAHTSYYILGP